MKKKILFNNHKFSGGAPSSMLEYAKLALENYSVITVGDYTEKDTLPYQYIKFGIDVIYLKAFKFKNILENFKNLNKYLRIIRKEKPSIIQSVSAENLIFDKAMSKVFGIPIIYLFAGGELPKIFMDFVNRYFYDEVVIVYSLEQKLKLNEAMNNNEVFVIPNRIDLSNISPNELKYSTKTKDKLNLLLISRFSTDKINSIKYVIELARNLSQNNIDLELNILGDGQLFDEVSKIVEEINKNLRKNIIILRGHVDDVNSYIYNSDIVFGKGKSVLNGVFNHTISIVVDENDNMFLINKSNFNGLLNSNFTGRNLDDVKTMSYSEFHSLIKKILNNNIDASLIHEIKILGSNHYDINFVKSKINSIYRKKENNIIQFNKLDVLIYIRVIYYYFLLLRIKILRR